MTNRGKVKKNRFIGFLSDYQERIIEAARLAEVSRDANMLLHIASLGLWPVSRYCEAIGLNRQGNRAGAESIAHELAEQGLSGFKAMALTLQAGIKWVTDPDEALMLYERAQPLADNPSTALTILKMKAVVMSDKFGEHQRAFQMLEQGVSLLRRIPSPLRADFLNSLAVECSNLGRFDQARQLCKITTLSPWSRQFPEWHQTARCLWEHDPKGRTMKTFVPRHKADLLKFTPALREPPEISTIFDRGRALEAVSRISDPRLLGCIAKFGLLRGPNLELLLRAQGIDPSLAEAVLHQIDKHESLGLQQICQREN